MLSPTFILISSILLESIGALLYNISSFMKSKRKIVGIRIGCDVCDLLTYIIVGGKTGLTNATASCVRDIVYSKWESRSLTILFAGIRCTLLLVGYEGILTLAFILMEIVTTTILFKGTAQHLRYAGLVTQIIWVCYDIAFVNFGVAAITATSCVMLLIAIINNRKEG